MTQLVLVLLAIAWIVVLAPDVARLFQPRRKATSSVDRFRQQLDSLGRSVPAATRIAPQPPSRGAAGGRRGWTSPTTTMPLTPQQASVRRRDIGTLLGLCTLVTLAGTLVTGSMWALGAFVCLLGLTAAYAALAVRRRRMAPTAEVHYLPLREQSSVSTVSLVRRTANE